jgi:hypothetical protein
MLTLARPYRQAMATIAVLGFLVTPTMAVGWYCWHVRQPGHRRDVERALGHTLGLDVSIREVRYPEPGLTALRGVTVRLPGSAAAKVSGSASASSTTGRGEVLTAEMVRARRVGEEMTLELDGPRLRCDGPRQAIQTLASLLDRGSALTLGAVHVVAPAVRLEPGAGLPPSRVRDLAASFRRDGEGLLATAQYRLGAAATTPWCELKLTRRRIDNVPCTELIARTRDDAAVPASVLNAFFDATRWLGEDARVAGEIALSQAGSDAWEARFRGTLRDVDLASVVARVAPSHHLAGRATVAIASSRWADQASRGPGWVEARGTMTASAGSVGPGFLEALARQLRFRVPDPAVTATGPLRYEALGLAFALEPTGTIRFDGALGPERMPGSILISSEQMMPLASAPEAASSVAGLIRALGVAEALDPSQVIPARFESLLLQRYLPTPPALPPLPPG